MPSGHETDPSLKDQNSRREALLDFVEGSTNRYAFFKYCYAVSGTFASASQAEQYQAFSQQMQESAVVVNELLKEVGGMAVAYVDEANGQSIDGRIMGCEGYDIEKNRWQMMLVNDQYPGVAGKPYLGVEFGPNEFRNSFLNVELRGQE